MDIENIGIAAKKDLKSKGKVGLAPLIRAAVVHIKAIAEGYAPSGPTVAALALMGDRKSMARILAELVDEGFRVSVVPPGSSAADWALYDAGLMCAADERVGTVVLATGDGREPFPELLEILLEAGKRVHVVSYDGAPFRMHIEGVEHTSLAPYLRLRLEEGGTESPIAVGFLESATCQPKDGESNLPVVAIPALHRIKVASETNTVEAVKRSYREAVRAILAGTSIEGLKRPVANLADAYKIYEDELAWGRDRCFSFGRLLGVLEAARVSGRLQAESEEEVGWIAKALVNFTDAFDHLDMYIESANGRFANLLKARITR